MAPYFTNCGEKMHFKKFFYLSFFFILIFAAELRAQGGYFDFTNYSGSTSSYGMGGEGVALRNSRDAFTYNPANLAFSDKVSLSLFHNPYQITGSSYPLNNVNAAFRIKGTGTFGLQYLRHEFGEFETTTPEQPDGIGMKEHFYDYALALGYASEVSDGLSVGLVLKYGHHNLGNSSKSSLLFSGGLNYQPEVFYKRVNFGLSLMNMGAPVKVESPYVNSEYRNLIAWIPTEYPVSSMIHLAANAIPFETEYLSTAMQIGFGKYLINDGLNDSKSSFSALFNDWRNFPQDASLSTGLAFEWKPLDLGNGFSFYQNFYLGTISSGPKTWPINNYFTHGAEIGVGYKEFAFSAGYSGRWHDVQGYNYYNMPVFPWETFQFSLEWDMNKHFNRESLSKAPAALKNILLSFGSGYNIRAGHFIPSEIEQYFKSRNGLSYTVESAFYINGNNALVAALYFTTIPFDYEYVSSYGKYTLNSKFETFGVYSAYRYHPLLALPALYVQGGVGIVRLNPVLNSLPKYSYQTSLNMASGANLDMFNNNLIVTPELNYQLMLVPISSNSSAPRLGGENQIALALKVGYRF